MITKICPSCGGKAEMHDPHLVHEMHVGHKIHHFFHTSRIFHAHPALAVVGMAGLGVAAAVKLFEQHHYRCENGHHFKA